MNKILCLVVAVTLAGFGATALAQTPPPAANNPGRGLMVMAPGCSYQMHNRRFRVGENMPATMSLRNTGEWCMGSVGMSGVAANGAHVVDQPDHGELRVKTIPAGVVFVYRPSPGYLRHSHNLLVIMAGL